MLLISRPHLRASVALAGKQLGSGGHRLDVLGAMSPHEYMLAILCHGSLTSTFVKLFVTNLH